MKLSDSATMLASFTAFLYCSSTAYHHGLFRTLKLDSDILVIGFHQSLYKGMLHSLTSIILFPMFLWFCFYCLRSWKESCSDAARKRNKFARAVIKIELFLTIRRKQRHKRFENLRAKSNRFLLIFFVVVFSLIHLAFLESEGKETGNQIITALSKAHEPSVTLPNDHKKYSFIFCGSNSCAFYEHKTQAIKYHTGHNFSYKMNYKSIVKN